MKQFLLTAIATALLGSGLGLATSLQAQAQQQDTRRVRIDTVRAQQQQQRAAPPGVQAVRQRIRQIGGGGAAVQRVVYPVIIPLASPVVVRDEEARFRRNGETLGSGTIRFREENGEQVPYYYPGAGDDLGAFGEIPYDQRSGGIRIRRSGDQGGQAGRGVFPDSVYIVFPDSMPAAPPRRRAPAPRPRQEQQPPTERRVERAILETGLFRASNVNFEFNQSALLPATTNTLDAVGEVLARYPELRIEVQGFTDAIGSESYNQRLSQQRAEAVARYMTSNFGIAAERLQPRGYGESRPIASNETSTGRTLNRRVTFRVMNPEAAERYLEEDRLPPPQQQRQQPEGEGAQDGEMRRQELRRLIREGLREELQRQQRENEMVPLGEDTTATGNDSGSE